MKRIKINSEEISFKNTIINYLNEVSVCHFVEGDELADVVVNIYKYNGNSYYDIIKYNMQVFVNENDNTDIFLKKVCGIIIEVFDIDSINFDLRIKDIDNISDINDKLNANYDKIGNTFSRGKDDPYISLDTIKASKGSTIYTTRRALNDAESEKYYGRSLSNAIRECDKHVGYKVFTDNGNLVYSSKMYKIDLNNNNKSEKEFMVIRNKGVGIKIKDNYGNLIKIPDGTKVIVSKISSKKSEIIIHLDEQNIRTEVNNSILSKM